MRHYTCDTCGQIKKAGRRGALPHTCPECKTTLKQHRLVAKRSKNGLWFVRDGLGAIEYVYPTKAQAVAHAKRENLRRVG